MLENDHSSKTGSGQTWGKLRQERRFLTGGAGQGLHGSGDPIYSNISWWNYTYEHGRLHTGQINVAWQLQDVTADDGGFVVGEYISQLQLRSLTLTRPLP